MDDNLYDEFGNYIGPEIHELNESLSEEEDKELQDNEEDATGKPLIVHNIDSRKVKITA
jgi:U5 small nuclear ribonucleoprotein component